MQGAGAAAGGGEGGGAARVFVVGGLESCDLIPYVVRLNSLSLMTDALLLHACNNAAITRPAHDH